MTQRRTDRNDLPEPRFAHVDEAEFERLQRLAGPQLVYRVVVDRSLGRRYMSPWIGEAQLRSAEEVMATSVLGFLAPEDVAPVEALTAELVSGERAGSTIVVGCRLGDGRLVPAAIKTTYVVSRDEWLFDCTVAILDAERMRAVSSNPLTPRQTEILQLLAEGTTTDEIAARLFLSKATVRNHVSAICRELGARSRIAAVATARSRGILH